ncbi:TPA: hypothetical protein ACF4EQ_004691 [Vibrio parahaemolyticus]|uniref:hypothetical protein n=1 Tax=Vibrio parahaemolyticus TaxID=670 RepID=UPI001E28CE9C|nr:hypothetical protein [Vibrio parahaemolyticus]MDF4993295.1 hypothetical protein [Vibrio parahaemolyticus]
MELLLSEVTDLILKVLPMLKSNRDANLLRVVNCLRDIEETTQSMQLVCGVKPESEYYLSVLHTYQKTLPLILNSQIPSELKDELTKQLSKIIAVRELWETGNIPAIDFHKELEKASGSIHAIKIIIEANTPIVAKPPR